MHMNFERRTLDTGRSLLASHFAFQKSIGHEVPIVHLIRGRDVSFQIFGRLHNPPVRIRLEGKIVRFENFRQIINK